MGTPERFSITGVKRFSFTVSRHAAKALHSAAVCPVTGASVLPQARKASSRATSGDRPLTVRTSH